MEILLPWSNIISFDITFKIDALQFFESIAFEKKNDKKTRLLENNIVNSLKNDPEKLLVYYEKQVLTCHITEKFVKPIKMSTACKS